MCFGVKVKAAPAQPGQLNEVQSGRNGSRRSPDRVLFSPAPRGSDASVFTYELFCATQGISQHSLTVSGMISSNAAVLFCCREWCFSAPLLEVNRVLGSA